MSCLIRQATRFFYVILEYKTNLENKKSGCCKINLFCKLTNSIHSLTTSPFAIIVFSFLIRYR